MLFFSPALVKFTLNKNLENVFQNFPHTTGVGKNIEDGNINFSTSLMDSPLAIGLGQSNPFM
jgi:hypothetical protein